MVLYIITLPLPRTDYNVLHAMLLDFQSGDNHNNTSRIYEKVAGRVGLIQQNMQPTGNTNYAAGTITQYGNGYSDKIYQTADGLVDGATKGIYFEPPNAVSVDMLQHIGANNAMTVGLKLVSGLLQNERYLPLLALKGAGLTLELTLASATNCFFSTTNTDADPPVFSAAVPTYTVQNVEYIAQTIDFDEAFTATFMSMIQANGLIQFHGVSYHSFVWTWSFTQSATEVVPIAMRARSLKAVLVSMRDNEIVGNAAAFSIGHRTSLNLSQYVFSIGGVRIPQAPVKINQSKEGLVEAYAEVVKAFSAFTDVQYAGRVGVEQYMDAGFAIAVDTEAYSQDTSLLESGMDTASQSLPVRLELTFSANNITTERASAATDDQGNLVIRASAVDTARADMYGMVDVIYSVTSDGLMTASD